MTKDFWLVAQGGAGGQFLWWWAPVAGVWEGGVEGVEEPCCLLLLWWQAGTLQSDGADGLGEWRAVIRGLQKRTKMLP